MAIINGTSGADNLVGTSAADTINGFDGNDIINAGTRPTVAGSGIDVVDGGAGFDTLVVNCSGETQSVQLFTGGSPTFQVRSTTGNFYVDAYNMEAVNFTGGSGNDSIDTGERSGAVNGGAGIDHWLADLGGLFTGVTFILGTTTSIAAAGLSSILSIERITLTTGAGNDTITGGSQADTISTGDGSDTIDAKTRQTLAGSGTDVVDGGLDTDTLIVNAAAETQGVQLFTGGSPTFQVRSTSNNFYVDAYNMEVIKFTGGSGADTIQTGTRGGTIDGGAGIDSWQADLSGLVSGVAFQLGTTTSIAAAGLTSILNLERMNLTTGSGNDNVIGGTQADIISTGNGNDTINARSRPTVAGSGTDVVDGGAGSDTLVVYCATETLGVQLFTGGSPTFQLRSTSNNFHVDAYNMETVQFTGGAGADFIQTGTLGGTVNGGGGIDQWEADLSALVSGVTFTLGTTTSIAAAGLTSILGLDRITLTTGAGDDTITGGSQADIIKTGGGNDAIDAKTRPTLAGSGTDVVDGGAGSDTLIVNASADTLGMQLFTGGSPTFQVRSTSGNFYVDAYNMEVIKFTGGSGADSIQTGTRGGTVDGGAGIDHWQADLAGLVTGVAFTLGTTTSIAAAGLTSILNLERLTLTTGSGNDAIIGGAQADSITTGAGNDSIDARTRPTAAGSGVDVVDGGAGSDMLIVNASAETQAVQLFAGGSPSFQVRSATGNFYVDAYNMESVTFHGSSAGDTITGNTGADILNGRAGADVLDGGVGDDKIDGGTEGDSIRGGRGADTLTGGFGADTLLYGAVLDSWVAGAKIDTVTDFVSGFDKFDLSAIDANNIGADGNQTFTFIGAAAFTGARGQLRAVAGVVEADVTGDGVADFRVVLSNGVAAVAADFVL
ncbi:MAG: calcium-binding protein [Inquilinus limosus]|uniref:Calcium-binding protein n=1 Tax=Inquilinus limosus TaxID=171674 RepID=A0A952FIR9_9PROT|nr:calcium-binding protein [Inquilinus limosus]